MYQLHTCTTVLTGFVPYKSSTSQESEYFRNRINCQMTGRVKCFSNFYVNDPEHEFTFYIMTQTPRAHMGPRNNP